MLVELLLLLETDEDKALFTSIVMEYEKRMCGVSRSIIKNRDSADDALHDSWVKILEQFEITKKVYYDPKSNFEGWLTAIVANTSKDALRQRKRAPEPLELWDIPSPENLEAKVEARIDLQIMNKMVRTMPPAMRHVLELRMGLGYSFKQIGKSMGCSAGAAEKRFVRAREELIKRSGMKFM